MKANITNTQLLILTAVVLINVQANAVFTPQKTQQQEQQEGMYAQQYTKPSTVTGEYKYEKQSVRPYTSQESTTTTTRKPLWERFKDWWYSSQEKPVPAQTRTQGSPANPYGQPAYNPNER